jgi:hypothetical protein
VARPLRQRVGVAGAGRGPFFGGGGKRIDRGTGRVVGNLAFAVLLTYLAVTGQLRWVLDAIVSLWVRDFSLLKMSCKWLDFVVDFRFRGGMLHLVALEFVLVSSSMPGGSKCKLS